MAMSKSACLQEDHSNTMSQVISTALNATLVNTKPIQCCQGKAGRREGKQKVELIFSPDATHRWHGVVEQGGGQGLQDLAPHRITEHLVPFRVKAGFFPPLEDGAGRHLCLPPHM